VANDYASGMVLHPCTRWYPWITGNAVTKSLSGLVGKPAGQAPVRDPGIPARSLAKVEYFIRAVRSKTASLSQWS